MDKFQTRICFHVSREKIMADPDCFSDLEKEAFSLGSDRVIVGDSEILYKKIRDDTKIFGDTYQRTLVYEKSP